MNSCGLVINLSVPSAPITAKATAALKALPVWPYPQARLSTIALKAIPANLRSSASQGLFAVGPCRAVWRLFLGLGLCLGFRDWWAQQEYWQDSP